MQSHATWPVFAGVEFERGTVCDTADVDEAQTLFSRAFFPHQLSVHGDAQQFRARMERLNLGPMTLLRFGWQARVVVDAGRLQDDYLLCLPVRGSAQCRQGRTLSSVSTTQAGLVGGGEPFSFTASADYQPLLVHVHRAAVDDAWTALAGEAPRAPIHFMAELPTDGFAWRAIAPVLQHVGAATRVAGVAGQQMALPHLPLRLQDLLLTTLLLSQPHSHAPRPVPAGSATSARVRRAQAYMRDHLDQPLTLSGIALAVGLPTRTLQWAFKQAEGVGPMQWLRQQRLHAVREALLADGPVPPRIADTALRFGFGHLGEFSQAYRRAFGETARDTLLRRR